MLTKPKQFEPAVQLIAASDDLAKAMIDARNAVDRVERLKDRLIADFEAIQKAADDLEFFTEEEAASIFKLKEGHLADLRRALDLPHSSFGNKPRYTKAHIKMIAEILEVNNRKAA